ncbi:MAG: FecR domain-containing protein [Ginsengibacter sp.]
MNQDYSHFSIDDFIADEYFLQWVKFPDEESNSFWKSWIAANPHKKEEITQAVNFVSSLHFEDEIPDYAHIEKRLNENMANLLQNETPEVRAQRPLRIRKYNMLWMACAASALVLAFIGWHFWPQNPAMINIVTGANEIKKIVLPDRSIVTLNANSNVTYAADMQKAEERELWLEGEAFFEVKHIEIGNKLARRFVVHSGKLNVEVLGTSFNISKKELVTNVTLNTGNIRIGVKGAPQTFFYMKPGDFIQYSSKENLLLKKNVKPELYSVWKDKKIVLKDMPLIEIIQLIEDTYGYTVTIENNELNNVKISGTLIMNDERSLLKTLEAALGIDIIKKDKNLLFQLKK